jgi:hypothetical protein
MGEVFFPVIAKLKWQDQLAFDVALSATDFRVGFAIGWAVNRHTGRARISQDALAIKIGVNIRTIQRSVDKLERHGHLQVHRRSLGIRKSDGRRVCGGRVAHLYEPIVKSTTRAPSFAPAGTTTNATTKDDSPDERGRHESRPFPLNPIYYPKKGRANARADRRSRIGAVPDALDKMDTEFGGRLRGAEFEVWLADRLGCDHATIIDQVSPQQLFSLQRRHASGHDLGEELCELAIKIAAIRRLDESR